MKLKANVKKAYTKAERGRIKQPKAEWVEIEEKVERVNNSDINRGFFVFYLNKKGEVFYDTYCKSLEEAIDTAYCDCDVKPEDWRVVIQENWDDEVEIDDRIDNDAEEAKKTLFDLLTKYSKMNEVERPVQPKDNKKEETEE